MAASATLSECLTFSARNMGLPVILFQNGRLTFCNLPVPAIVLIQTSLRYHFLG